MLASLTGCKVPVGIQKNINKYRELAYGQIKEANDFSLRRSININGTLMERITIGKKNIGGHLSQ